MSASTCRAQVDQFTYGGHTYRYFGNASAQNWSGANAQASLLQVGTSSGYLARIDDAAENAAVFSRLLSNSSSYTLAAPDGGGGRYAWIGASDIAAEGDWRWSNNSDPFWSGNKMGSAVAGRYNNWGTTMARNEPDNFLYMGQDQDAAAISLNGWPLGVAGQWNDVRASNVMGFIVEFNSVPEPASVAAAAMAALLMLGRRARVHGK